MEKRNRPRKPPEYIGAVLRAFRKEYGNDMDAFESMCLSMMPGEGVGVKNGKLAKIHFWPKHITPPQGASWDW